MTVHAPIGGIGDIQPGQARAVSVARVFDERGVLSRSCFHWSDCTVAVLLLRDGLVEILRY